jgi:3-dehydroquinate synthase
LWLVTQKIVSLCQQSIERMKIQSTEIQADNYSVFIGANALSDLSIILQQDVYKGRKTFIIVDENTFEKCLPTLLSEVPELEAAQIIQITSGEENKNITVCSHIWEALGNNGADRKSLIINLGGGVITDLGGFVASTYKRGVSFINIPTTLLSQVDASVGGKVGIDFNMLKNQIGVFSNPDAVIVCPKFLNTLSKRQVMSGFAEVIKHGLIADANYWEKIKTVNIADFSKIDSLIFQSVMIKNQVVLEDPFEGGLRKILNFGHTIGHAIETHSFEEGNKVLLHGEAIGIGMIAEAYLATKTCGLTENELEDISDFILSVYPKYDLANMQIHRLLELMSHDKKNEKGVINFSLLSAIGVSEINQKCSTELVIEALNYYILKK